MRKRRPRELLSDGKPGLLTFRTVPCPLYHTVLHGPELQGITKDICHISPPCLAYTGTRPKSPYPIRIPAATRPPQGTPTGCPFLSHTISGAGKPFASHSSVSDCPTMPDTLALRLSSRMLGGTGEHRKAGKLTLLGEPQPPEPPSGPLFLAWTGSPNPNPSPGSGVPGCPPQPDLATGSLTDPVPRPGTHTPWGYPGALTLSNIDLCNVGAPPPPIYLPLHPTCCQGHLRDCPRPEPLRMWHLRVSS